MESQYHPKITHVHRQTNHREREQQLGFYRKKASVVVNHKNSKHDDRSLVSIKMNKTDFANLFQICNG